MSQNQDQQYIDDTINGDTRAFSVLVNRYKHMVFTLAMRILRNREEAEEVAQDVFVKAYLALATFKGDSKFSTWMYQITYRQSLDYIKKRNRILKTISIDEFTEHDIPSLENALDRLEAEDRRATIKNTMDKLPVDDAVLITLHYFKELSLKEISQIMGLRPNTVKVRLFRSRKRLSVLLKERLEPEIIGSYGKE